MGATEGWLTVTSTVKSLPGQPKAEVRLTVYSTVPDPTIAVNTSAIVVAQPPGQLPFPTIEPAVTAELHVKSLPEGTELKGILVGEPLQRVKVGVVVPTGIAPTVSVAVKALPVQPPPVDVGIIVYNTVPVVVPLLFNVCDMVVPQADVQALAPVILPEEGVTVHV